METTLEAYAYGNGLKLIAPIVHTFTYDLTRPVFHQVELSPGSWRAGGMRLTDDNSDIQRANADATFFLLDANGEKTCWRTFSTSPT